MTACYGGVLCEILSFQMPFPKSLMGKFSTGEGVSLSVCCLLVSKVSVAPIMTLC